MRKMDHQYTPIEEWKTRPVIPKDAIAFQTHQRESKPSYSKGATEIQELAESRNQNATEAIQ
jgi:hypothetical protein